MDFSIYSCKINSKCFIPVRNLKSNVINIIGDSQFILRDPCLVAFLEMRYQLTRQLVQDKIWEGMKTRNLLLDREPV